MSGNFILAISNIIKKKYGNLSTEIKDYFENFKKQNLQNIKESNKRSIKKIKRKSGKERDYKQRNRRTFNYGI
jgi:hypothetical protein